MAIFEEFIPPKITEGPDFISGLFERKTHESIACSRAPNTPIFSFLFDYPWGKSGTARV